MSSELTRTKKLQSSLGLKMLQVIIYECDMLSLDKKTHTHTENQVDQLYYK